MSVWNYQPSTAGLNQHFVQGKKASLNEYNVAMALDRMSIEYAFLYEMYGGIGQRGGLQVDFVTTLFNIPIEVFGERWHTGALGADDKIRLHRLASIFRHPPIVIWGQESEMQDDAFRVLKERYRAPA